MAFNLDNLTAYVDQLSFEIISKAVLNTDLMGEIQVRPGLSAGKVAINLLEGDLDVTDRACGFEASGDITFSQVEIEIANKQVKMEVCVQDLRDYYLSQKMGASAYDETVPAEEIIVDFYIKKIKEYNEGYLINGDGTRPGLAQQITAANGANVVSGASAWTPSNALEEALDLYDAIGEAVKDRNDLIMVVSPAAYRALTRALVAANLYHFDSVGGNVIVELPGTNCKVVKSSGLINSNWAFAGPAGFIIAGVGLTDDMDQFKMMYDNFQDITKVAAYWRLGIAVHEVEQFASNGFNDPVPTPTPTPTPPPSA
jgi:hypothetical protein